MFIHAEKNFYVPICDSRYDKILKTHDYFQNININIMFLLIKFLFYMQNIVQCLHCFRCRF